jgi:hypothetical protein
VSLPPYKGIENQANKKQIIHKNISEIEINKLLNDGKIHNNVKTLNPVNINAQTCQTK